MIELGVHDLIVQPNFRYIHSITVPAALTAYGSRLFSALSFECKKLRLSNRKDYKEAIEVCRLPL